jgi:hypothetical protein
MWPGTATAPGERPPPSQAAGVDPTTAMAPAHYEPQEVVHPVRTGKTLRAPALPMQWWRPALATRRRRHQCRGCRRKAGCRRRRQHFNDSRGDRMNTHNNADLALERREALVCTGCGAWFERGGRGEPPLHARRRRFRCAGRRRWIPGQPRPAAMTHPLPGAPSGQSAPEAITEPGLRRFQHRLCLYACPWGAKRSKPTGSYHRAGAQAASSIGSACMPVPGAPDLAAVGPAG